MLLEEQLQLFFIVVRTVQLWNKIDLPDPVGKTPVTSWPFRIDSKHFTWSGLKLSDGKLLLLMENPTWQSTDKNSYLLCSTCHLWCFVYRMQSYANLVHPKILGVWWSCDRLMPGPFPTPLLKPGNSTLGTRLVNSGAQWIVFEHWFTYTAPLNFTRFKGIIKAFRRMCVWLTSITFAVIWLSVLIAVTWVALLWAGLSVLPN